MVKSVFNFTFTLISFLALALLLAPTTINGIIIYLCGGLLTSIIFGMIKSRVQFEASHSTKIYAFEMMFTLFLIHDFYHLWIPSSRLSVLSKSLHMSTELFLWIVAGTLGILSLRAIDRVIQLVQVMLQRIPVKESVEGAIKNCFYIFIVLLLESYQMDYSVLSSMKSFFGHGILIICVNILLAFLLNMIFVVLMQRWKYALFITNCFFTVWSIANYYVIKFHGSPLFPITLYTSGRTGLEVAGTYRYTPDYTVVCLVSICLVNSMIVFSCLKEVKTAFSLRNISLRLISVGSIFAVLVILFMGKGGILPAGGSKETWDHTIIDYGFIVSSVWNIKNHDSWLIKPDYYSQEKIDSFKVFENKDTISNEEYPDIILILNETFCDLNIYADLQTDRDYLSDFCAIDGADYGKAITPLIGGGTNDSEFELLSSKSVGLLSTNAPFTYFPRSLDGRGIVEYLHNLGYTSTGMHCGSKTNYCRDIVYPTVGFDNIFLGADDFKYYRKNGNRSWYDSDNYKDLIECYQEHHNEGPQFFYLLTFQNHGGYEQNDDSLDTIHVEGDFADLADDMNEYLSSIELSGKALKELTEFFSRVDRHVILCMVGDHAPPFIKKLGMDESCPIQNSEIAMRIVPYVMWSNYGVDFLNGSDYVTMTDIVPLLLKSAGMPMSTFYNEIVNLHESLPIRTSDGLCVDSKGTIGKITDHDYNEHIQNYYIMEYNSLLTTDHYREELFLPDVS